MFRQFQRVECVDDAPCQCCGVKNPGLVKGERYTVRDTIWENGQQGLLLAECEQTPYHDGFHASRFRPLTDISVFRALLKSKTLEEV